MVLYFIHRPFRGQKISATVTYALLDRRACSLGAERLASKKKKEKKNVWDKERLLHREQTFKNAVLILKIHFGGYHNSVVARVVCKETGIYSPADSSSQGTCHAQLPKSSLSSSVPLLQVRQCYIDSCQPREFHGTQSLHMDI